MIQRLEPEHAAVYRALMLQAYARHPEAFTSEVSERSDLPLSWWERRLSAEPRPQHMVFGAFADVEMAGELAGVAGLSFETRPKLRHKAALFGMYVAPAFRQRGLGRALVNAVLAGAKARAGVKVIQLTVTQGNAKAIALYEACGFKPFGVEPFAMAVANGFVSKVHLWQEVDDDAGSLGPVLHGCAET
jgi:RimJ/RimL family protein N-acetyltransferase